MRQVVVGGDVPEVEEVVVGLVFFRQWRSRVASFPDAFPPHRAEAGAQAREQQQTAVPRRGVESGSSRSGGGDWNLRNRRAKVSVSVQVSSAAGVCAGSLQDRKTGRSGTATGEAVTAVAGHRRHLDFPRRDPRAAPGGAPQRTLLGRCDVLVVGKQERRRVPGEVAIRGGFSRIARGQRKTEGGAPLADSLGNTALRSVAARATTTVEVVTNL